MIYHSMINIILVICNIECIDIIKYKNNYRIIKKQPNDKFFNIQLKKTNVKSIHE